MKHEPWSLGASLPGAVTKNGIEWVTLPFRALDAAVLYRVLALRSSIFVVEQECLYQDIDGLDQHALIVVGIRPWGATGDHGATLFDVIATARILPPGVGFDDPSMGRAEPCWPTRCNPPARPSPASPSAFRPRRTWRTSIGQPASCRSRIPIWKTAFRTWKC